MSGTTNGMHMYTDGNVVDQNDLNSTFNQSCGFPPPWLKNGEIPSGYSFLGNGTFFHRQSGFSYDPQTGHYSKDGTDGRREIFSFNDKYVFPMCFRKISQQLHPQSADAAP